MVQVFGRRFFSRDARSDVGGVTILKVKLLSLNWSSGQTDVSIASVA